MSAQFAPSKKKEKTFIIHRNRTFCLTVWLSFFFWGGGGMMMQQKYTKITAHSTCTTWGKLPSAHEVDFVHSIEIFGQSWWKSSLENREKPPLVKNTSPTWRWYKMCFLDVSRIFFWGGLSGAVVLAGAWSQDMTSNLKIALKWYMVAGRRNL